MSWAGERTSVRPMEGIEDETSDGTVKKLEKIEVARVSGNVMRLIGSLRSSLSRWLFFFFKERTAYEIKECDWSSDVCSSDLSGV